MTHTTDNPPAGPEMDEAICRLFDWRFQFNPATRSIWRFFASAETFEPFSPSTDPAADYEVLKHVREKYADGTGRAMEWAAFLTALNAVYQPRRRQDYKAFELAIHCDHYQPGDYSRAALAAAAGKEKA